MLRGDSEEYKLLAKWVNQMEPQDFYLTVEIGVREGAGSDVITNVLRETNTKISENNNFQSFRSLKEIKINFWNRDPHSQYQL